MMLIHNICMALRGLGSFITVERAIRDKAAILLQIGKKMRFPSIHLGGHLKIEGNTLFIDCQSYCGS